MLDFDDLKTYELLLEGCGSHHVDPSSSLASEQYFRQLLSRYEGQEDRASVLRWLDKELSQRFKSIGDPPRWLQDPQWPFAGDDPMVLAGQVDVPGTAGVFHDDTSLYVFIGEGVAPVVVIQQT